MSGHAAFLILICLTSAAWAQEEKAVLDGRAVLVTRGIDADIQISYDQPDMPLILRGKWQDPPNGVLDGMAYAHREGCPSLEYRVKGVVDRGGALMVFGYEPQMGGNDCAQTGSTFKALRFTLPPPTMVERKPKKAKPKPKPELAKPKPKPKPRPQPSPYWQPWQWRT